VELPLQIYNNNSKQYGSSSVVGGVGGGGSIMGDDSISLLGPGDMGSVVDHQSSTHRSKKIDKTLLFKEVAHPAHRVVSMGLSGDYTTSSKKQQKHQHNNNNSTVTNNHNNHNNENTKDAEGITPSPPVMGSPRKFIPLKKGDKNQNNNKNSINSTIQADNNTIKNNIGSILEGDNELDNQTINNNNDNQSQTSHHTHNSSNKPDVSEIGVSYTMRAAIRVHCRKLVSLFRMIDFMIRDTLYDALLSSTLQFQQWITHVSINNQIDNIETAIKINIEETNRNQNNDENLNKNLLLSTKSMTTSPLKMNTTNTKNTKHGAVSSAANSTHPIFLLSADWIRGHISYDSTSPTNANTNNTHHRHALIDPNNMTTILNHLENRLPKFARMIFTPSMSSFISQSQQLFHEICTLYTYAEGLFYYERCYKMFEPIKNELSFHNLEDRVYLDDLPQNRVQACIRQVLIAYSDDFQNVMDAFHYFENFKHQLNQCEEIYYDANEHRLMGFSAEKINDVLNQLDGQLQQVQSSVPNYLILGVFRIDCSIWKQNILTVILKTQSCYLHLIPDLYVHFGDAFYQSVSKYVDQLGKTPNSLEDFIKSVEIFQEAGQKNTQVNDRFMFIHALRNIIDIREIPMNDAILRQNLTLSQTYTRYTNFLTDFENQIELQIKVYSQEMQQRMKQIMIPINECMDYLRSVNMKLITSTTHSNIISSSSASSLEEIQDILQNLYHYQRAFELVNSKLSKLEYYQTLLNISIMEPGLQYEISDMLYANILLWKSIRQFHDLVQSFMAISYLDVNCAHIFMECFFMKNELVNNKYFANMMEAWQLTTSSTTAKAISNATPTNNDNNNKSAQSSSGGGASGSSGNNNNNNIFVEHVLEFKGIFQIYHELLQQVSSLLTIIPIIQQLQSSTLKLQHINAIHTLIQHNIFDADYDITVGELVDVMQIVSYRTEIQQIYQESKILYHMEQMVINIDKHCNCHLLYHFQNDHDNKSFLTIGNFYPLHSILQQFQRSLIAMQQSRYSTMLLSTSTLALSTLTQLNNSSSHRSNNNNNNYLDEQEQLNNNGINVLLLLQRMVDTWSRGLLLFDSFQQAYLKIRILFTSPRTTRQMASAMKYYKIADEHWRYFMKQAKDHPNIPQFFHQMQTSSSTSTSTTTNNPNNNNNTIPPPNNLLSTPKATRTQSNDNSSTSNSSANQRAHNNSSPTNNASTNNNNNSGSPTNINNNNNNNNSGGGGGPALHEKTMVHVLTMAVDNMKQIDKIFQEFLSEECSKYPKLYLLSHATLEQLYYSQDIKYIILTLMNTCYTFPVHDALFDYTEPYNLHTVISSYEKLVFLKSCSGRNHIADWLKLIDIAIRERLEKDLRILFIQDLAPNTHGNNNNNNSVSLLQQRSIMDELRSGHRYIHQIHILKLQLTFWLQIDRIFAPPTTSHSHNNHNTARRTSSTLDKHLQQQLHGNNNNSNTHHSTNKHPIDEYHHDILQRLKGYQHELQDQITLVSSLYSDLQNNNSNNNPGGSNNASSNNNNDSSVGGNNNNTVHPHRTVIMNSNVIITLIYFRDILSNMIADCTNHIHQQSNHNNIQDLVNDDEEGDDNDLGNDHPDSGNNSGKIPIYQQKYLFHSFFYPFRKFIDPLTNTVYVQQGHIIERYGMKYQGFTHKLVITPLTERCWFSLMQTFQLFNAHATTSAFNLYNNPTSGGGPNNATNNNSNNNSNTSHHHSANTHSHTTPVNPEVMIPLLSGEHKQSTLQQLAYELGHELLILNVQQLNCHGTSLQDKLSNILSILTSTSSWVYLTATTYANKQDEYHAQLNQEEITSLGNMLASYHRMMQDRIQYDAYLRSLHEHHSNNNHHHTTTSTSSTNSNSSSNNNNSAGDNTPQGSGQGSGGGGHHGSSALPHLVSTSSTAPGRLFCYHFPHLYPTAMTSLQPLLLTQPTAVSPYSACLSKLLFPSSRPILAPGNANLCYPAVKTSHLYRPITIMKTVPFQVILTTILISYHFVFVHKLATQLIALQDYLVTRHITTSTIFQKLLLLTIHEMGLANEHIMMNASMQMTTICKQFLPKLQHFYTQQNHQNHLEKNTKNMDKNKHNQNYQNLANFQFTNKIYV
jgi:hypothetical protein